MKRLFFFFLFFPLLAQGAIRLTGLQYKEIAPPGFAHVCKLTNGTDYGYQIRRDEAGNYLVTSINKGQLEKTRQAVVEPDHGTFIVFLEIFERSGDYGKYLELRLEQKVDMNTGFMGGVVMLTESSYSKDENGVEKEELTPISRRPLACNPVAL